MKKTVFFSLLSLCLGTAGFAQLVPGSAAPAVSLPNVMAQQVSLQSLKGKVVLVDFWASWCGPCRRAMPEVKKLHQQYAAKGFEVYGVSLDADRKNWVTALKTLGAPGLQVLNADGNVANEWKVSYIPTTFLIDKKGNVHAVNATQGSLEVLIPKLLAEKG